MRGSKRVNLFINSIFRPVVTSSSFRFVLFCFLLFSLAARAVRTSIPWRVNKLGAVDKSSCPLVSSKNCHTASSFFASWSGGNVCCLLCFSCSTDCSIQIRVTYIKGDNLHIRIILIVNSKGQAYKQSAANSNKIYF